MIRILLVEDDASKRREIASVLTRVSGMREADVDVATDVISAKRKLESSGFDLLLLDINLPKRADAYPNAAGGLEVLRWLKGRGKRFRPNYIVGTTIYEASLVLAQSEFNNLIWSIVCIDLSDGAWKGRLSATVMAIIDQIVPPFASDGVTFRTDVGILTALRVPELQAVLKLPLNWQDAPVRFDETSYHSGEYRRGQKKLSLIAASAPDKGLPAAAISATKLIQAFRPRYLVMTGICAGVRGRVGLGDLLMADPSYDWGSGKTLEKTKKTKSEKVVKGPDFFQPAPYQMRVDQTMRNRAESVLTEAILLELLSGFSGKKPRRGPKLVIGPVASGAAVLQSDSAVARIVDKHKDLKGIDMEIYSVMLACHVAGLPRPTCFTLKAVCDFGDRKKSDGYQRFASYLSAEALYRFLGAL